MNMLALFVLGGVLVAGVGVWLCLKTYALVGRGRRAEGRYVDAVWASAGQGQRLTQYGTIEFQTEAGQVVRFEGRTGTPFEQRKVGRAVEVLYDPSRPEDAVVNSFVELWLPGLIFLTIGIGWAVFAAIAMLIGL
jgi:hypothetical protein